MTSVASSGPIWETGDRPGFPQVEGHFRADLCVVGLGGSGLSAVGAGLAAGRSVVGIDAGTVGGAAAGRNAGFLLAGMAPFHHDLSAAVGAERAIALYRLTEAEIARMASETPAEICRTGSLRIAASQDEVADCEQQLEVMRSHGLPGEAYEGPEGVGLLFPDDAVVQPLARCRTLAGRAAADGAVLFERTPAVEITGRRVSTPFGRVDCDSVVVAVDGGLETVLPELAERVRTARAQVLATEPLVQLRFTRPVYTRWGYDYYQQLSDRRLVLGGFRDRGLETEWTAEAEPTDAIQGHLESFLRENLGVEAAVTHRWAGSIAFTDDKLPVLEEVRPGVWACGAYSGTGNVVGAICGRLAAQLALGLPAPGSELLR